MISMDDKYRSRGKIGGPGHVVEIDHVVISRKICMVPWICGSLDSKSFPPFCELYRNGD
jgi:hypothetical protein